MLRSYLKTAVRTLWRHKGYTLINVVGLSVGLACSIFILLWVDHELSYDRFHEDGERIYRVMRNYYPTSGQVYTWESVPMPLAAVLKNDYPEIKDATLITWQNTVLLAHEDQAFREDGHWAASNFFEVFTFPLVLGDTATALQAPHSIVLSESAAAKLFGPGWREAGILGRTVRADNETDFRVTGVFADVPANSSLAFDFIIPIQEYIDRNEWTEHWGNSGLRLYVRLREGTDGQAVSAKIKNVIREHHESANADIFLQPLTDLRLRSNYADGRLVGGRIEYVRLFAVVAVFILLIACINFMNLATARSARRAREIGVRKAVGATQRGLVGQFMGESILLAYVALAVALGLVVLLLPGFNELADKTFSLDALFRPRYVLLFLGLAALTGLLAGSYPALYLSSFNVVNVMRGTLSRSPGAARFRQVLVVLQFTLSIVLIIGTLTVYRQMDYIRSKNLGLERSGVVSLTWEGGIRDQYEAFREELLRQPGIEAVTTSSQNPLSVGNSTSDPEWDGKDPDSEILFHIINAHHDFVETMQMEMLDGRAHSSAFPADTANYVINEAAAQAMGLDDPVGERLEFWDVEGRIIGLVRNFHMQSLYDPYEPLIIRLDPDETWIAYVRIAPDRATEALDALKTTYAAFNPGYPFTYRFLDEQFEEMYENEQTIGRLATNFAVLAVFISCLGLFGLASFMAEQRTKEIGIRKVLGASIANLIVLLTTDFTRLVLIAFALAAPLAYFLMAGWLERFTFHMSLGVGLFAAAGVAALAIAWLTVGYQSFRAAAANPVRSLRTE